MSDTLKLTPTQARILEVLSDGRSHTREELLECLADPKYSTPDNLNKHITWLRDKLRPIGEDIVCTLMNRRIGYRQVRTLKPNQE